MFPFPVTLSDP